MTEKAERLKQMTSCVFDPTSGRFVLTAIFDPRCDKMFLTDEIALVREIVRDAIASEYHEDKRGESQKIKDHNLALSEDNAELIGCLQELALLNSKQRAALQDKSDELAGCQLQLSMANKSMSELVQVNAKLAKDRQNLLSELAMYKADLHNSEKVCVEAIEALTKLSAKVRERAKVIQQQCNQIAGLKKAALELKHARTVIVPTFGVPYGEHRK